MTTRYEVFWFENGEAHSMNCETYEDIKLFPPEYGVRVYSVRHRLVPREVPEYCWTIIRRFEPGKKNEK